MVGGIGTPPVAAARENAVQVLLRPLLEDLVVTAERRRFSGIVPRAVAGAVGIPPVVVDKASVLQGPPKPSPVEIVVRRLVPAMVAVDGGPGQRVAVRENARRGIGSLNARGLLTIPT